MTGRTFRESVLILELLEDESLNDGNLNVTYYCSPDTTLNRTLCPCYDSGSEHAVLLYVKTARHLQPSVTICILYSAVFTAEVDWKLLRVLSTRSHETNGDSESKFDAYMLLLIVTGTIQLVYPTTVRDCIVRIIGWLLAGSCIAVIIAANYFPIHSSFFPIQIYRLCVALVMVLITAFGVWK
jgi:hypothetical protein